MKNTLTIAIIFISLFLSTICFSQTVIEKHICDRYKGSAKRDDLISSLIMFSAERLDSVKVCRWAEHLFASLNINFYDKNYSLLLGGVADSLHAFTITILYSNTDNTLTVLIANTTTRGIIVPDNKAKEIIEFQMKLADRIIKEIQSI